MTDKLRDYPSSRNNVPPMVLPASLSHTNFVYSVQRALVDHINRTRFPEETVLVRMISQEPDSTTRDAVKRARAVVNTVPTVSATTRKAPSTVHIECLCKIDEDYNLFLALGLVDEVIRIFHCATTMYDYATDPVNPNICPYPSDFVMKPIKSEFVRVTNDETVRQGFSIEFEAYVDRAAAYFG